MKRWVAAILLLGLAAFANDFTWVFNRTLLEQRLPPGVDVDGLTRALEKEGIDVEFEKRKELILWTGKRVSISLAAISFNPYHLWVAVEGRKTLDECTTDELAELYDAIWMGRKAIAETTGAAHFMIFTAEQPRAGQRGSSVGFEIIPYGFGGGEQVMDAVEKNTLNDYVFYNRLCLREVSHSPETLEAIREILPTLQPVVPPENPQGLWTQKFLRHTEALHENIQSIHDLLIQYGILVKGEVPPLPEQQTGAIHEVLINHDKCALCNPKVIENQLICEWKDVYVLLNHKPITIDGDFLIIPKRHQCTFDLTREEAIASFQAIIAFKKLFAETMGSNHWVCYIQDGPLVGQTVPHTNIHFLLFPNRLNISICGLQQIHNQRRILSHEALRSSCEKFKPKLQEQLRSANL
ncbi:MAG TPA: HIT domain-containing protein [Chlamydiales bacterium]|nr:HIT domain-containing protein [Chlamydiales bacterium]